MKLKMLTKMTTFAAIFTACLAFAFTGMRAFADVPAVAQIGTDVYSTLDASLAAVKDGETIVLLGDTTVPETDGAIANLNGKTITIKGQSGKPVVMIGDGKVSGSDGRPDYRFTGASVTFKDVTIQMVDGDAELQGFAYPKSLVFDGCTIKGKLHECGSANTESCTFDGCVFEHGDAYDYCLLTYGCHNVTVRNSTFNTQGKALKMYWASQVTLTVENCVFNSNGKKSTANKPAILIVNKDWSADYRLNITGCTQNGFVAGVIGDAMWGTDDAADIIVSNDRPLVVSVNNVQVYPVVAAAKIVETGVKYLTLKEAADAATSGQTIELLSNYTVTSDEVVAIKDGVKFTAGSYALTNKGRITIAGEVKFSAGTYTGDLHVGDVGKATVLTTDGLVAKGAKILYLVDGSTVTLSGDGFDLDFDDDGDYMMIENSAEEKNSWDESGNLNHVGSTLNITGVAEGMKVYALYTNAGSDINVTNTVGLKSEVLNVYGGQFNMVGGSMLIDQTVNVSGVINYNGTKVLCSYVNVYAGHEAGYHGGKLNAVDSTLDGSDWQMKVGNTRDKSKYYEKGEDGSAVITLTRSTLKSSQFTNKGMIRMDAASKIVLAASGEASFAGDYQVGESGCIEVDMTGATEESYTLVSAAAASSYGTAGTNYKFADGRANNYELKVVDNYLVAVKKAVDPVAFLYKGEEKVGAYGTIQDAVDAYSDAKEGGSYLIAICGGEYAVTNCWIVQSKSKSLTIQPVSNGGVFESVTLKSGATTSVFSISGVSSYDTLPTVINKIAFDGSAMTGNYGILNMGSGNDVRYACRVTVSNCSFHGDAAKNAYAGYAANNSSPSDIRFVNCVGDSLWSLWNGYLANNAGVGITVTGCTVTNSQYFVCETSGSGDIVVENCKAVIGGAGTRAYAIRYGGSGVSSSGASIRVTESEFVGDTGYCLFVSWTSGATPVSLYVDDYTATHCAGQGRLADVLNRQTSGTSSSFNVYRSNQLVTTLRGTSSSSGSDCESYFFKTVAQIVSADGQTTLGYDTLQLAFDNVQEGETINVLADNTESTTVTNTCSFTFNSNGHSLGAAPTVPAGYEFVKGGDVCTYRQIPYDPTKWSGTTYEAFATSPTTDDEATTFIANMPAVVKNYITVDAANKKVTLSSADAFAFISYVPNYLAALCKIDCKEKGYSDPRLSAYWVGAEHHSWVLSITTDVDLQKKDWHPATSGYSYLVDFNNHTVSNLKATGLTTDGGLFGDLYYGQNLTIDGATVATTADNAGVFAGSLSGFVKNVTVKNATLSGGKYAGAIGGYVYGDVENCKVIGTEQSPVVITSATKEAGAVVGIFAANHVQGCEVAYVNVTAQEEVGGVVGRVVDGDVKTHQIADCMVANITLKATKNGETVIASAIVGGDTANFVGTICGRDYFGTLTITENGVQIYPVVAAAKIVETGVKYLTLKEAADAATSGQTIELLSNYTVTSDEVVAIKDGVKFTAGSYALTNKGRITIAGEVKFSAGTYTGDLHVGDVGKATVLTTDGLVAKGAKILYLVDGSTVTLSGDGFDLDFNDKGDYMMIENSAEEKNSWDESGNLNHAGSTLNITGVAEGMKVYALYTNAGSDINVTNTVGLKSEFLNVYGGQFNMVGGSMLIDQTVNVSGVINYNGTEVLWSYVNVYAGHEAGYHGGKLNAVDSTLDGSDWQMQVGNTRDKSKYYEKGEDGSAVITLTRSTLKSSQFTNKGMIRMDAASKIVLAASGENDFAGDYQVGESGCIEVDMTGATEESYTLVSAAAASSYGTAGTNYKFADGKANNYELKVVDNDLVAKKLPNFYQDANDQSLWHIRNLAGLKEFRTSINTDKVNYKNCTIRLDSNINLTDDGDWTPIAAYVGGTEYRPLDGATFDGAGHAITGMRISAAKGEQGFFSVVAAESVGFTVKNLAFKDAKVEVPGGGQHAIVVGHSYSIMNFDNVDLTDCLVTGTTKTGLLLGQCDADGHPSKVTVKNCDIVNSQTKANYSAALLVGLMIEGTAEAVFENNTVDTNSKFIWVSNSSDFADKGNVINGRYYFADGTTLWLTDPGEKCLGEQRVSDATLTYQGTTYSVKGSKFYPELDFVAKIGDLMYMTLQEAFDAVQKGETINMLADNTESTTVTNTCTFTFNSNGHMLGAAPIVPDGYGFVKNGDVCIYQQVSYVARIVRDGVNCNFATIADAIADVREGETVLLINDTDEDAQCGAVSFTFNQNGFEWTGERISGVDDGLNHFVDIGEGIWRYVVSYAAQVILPDGTSTIYENLESAVADWTDGSTLKFLSDGSASLIVPSGESRTLDLNGCVLSNSTPVTVLSGAGLVVTDSNPTKEHKFAVAKNGLWTLEEGKGTKTLAGGCITGGQSDVGGGILNGGTLEMRGGNVVGNRANLSGGGIANIEGASAFKLSGGCIKGNVADYGGGVSFEPVDGTFTMTGGEISENVAVGVFLEEYDISKIAPGITPSVVTNSCGGGGVFNAGTFNMSGGEIKDNTANVSNGGGVCNGKTGRFNLSGGKTAEKPHALISGCKALNGGGIANYAVLKITGGRIADCVAQNLGGGIYTRTFGMENGMEMSDGIIVNCSAKGEAGDGIASDGGTVVISGNSEITLSFDGFNSGVGVFANGGTLAVRGGKIQVETKVSAGELAHLTRKATAVRVVYTSFTIEHGEVKAENGDAIWAEMYDSKFTLTGDAKVVGNIVLKVVSSDKIEISGGLVAGKIDATDEVGNKHTEIISNLDARSTKQDDDMYTKKPAVTDNSVASVTPAGSSEAYGYDTISAAFNNMTAGCRVKILKKGTYNANVDIRINATIELNGSNVSGSWRDDHALDIVSGANGGGETVTLSQFYSNSHSRYWESYADVHWGTDGKPITIVADRVSVTQGKIVLCDSADVTINSTPGGYAGIKQFVLNSTTSDDGTVQCAKLTLKSGRYGSNVVQIRDTATGAITERPMSDFVAEGLVVRDNGDWTFSVIVPPVKFAAVNPRTTVDAVSSEDENGTPLAVSASDRELAETVSAQVGNNAAVEKFQDTHVDATVKDGNDHVTSATVALLQGAAEEQVSQVNVEAAKEAIAAATDVKTYINVKLTNTTIRTYTVASEAQTKTVCSAVVYDVKPVVTVKVMDGAVEKEVTAVIDNDQIKESGKKITFRLPVPSSFVKTVMVLHEGKPFGVYTVQTETSSDKSVVDRFVELESDSFSAWTIQMSDAVACIGAQGYKSLAAAFAAAKQGDTIELCCDSEATETAENAYEVTLDLCGCTVTGTGIGTLINNTSSLTVVDSVGEGALRVSCAGEAYAIRTSAGTGAAAIIVRKGKIDGIFTDGANVVVDLNGGKFDRACKCVANSAPVGKITNGLFKSEPSLATDAARETAAYVAETHYLSYDYVNGYRGIDKNDVRAAWTDGEGKVQTRYYATFADAITACYGCKDLEITLCDNVSGTISMPTDHEGTFRIVTNGKVFNITVKPGDGYVLAKEGSDYVYQFGTNVAEVVVAGSSPTGYPSVKRAVAAAPSGATVRLLANCTTDTVGVSAGKELTLELNGFELRGEVVTGIQDISAVRATILNAGTLTIKDSSAGKTGCIYNSAIYSAGTGRINPAIYNYENSTLTIEGGTIGKTSANYGEAVYNDGTAYIKGGRYTNLSSSQSTVFLNNSKGAMAVTGGEIFGTVDGWFANNGTLTIGEGFKTTAKVGRYGIIGTFGSTTTVTGGDFSLVHNSSTFVPSVFLAGWKDSGKSACATINVSGGVFTGEASYPQGFAWRLYNPDYGMPVLTGGTYPVNVYEACASDYYCHHNDNGTWTVQACGDNIVAKVGDVCYDDLADAIDAVAANGTVTLEKDVTLTETLTLKSDKIFTLDLKGKTLTGTIESGVEGYKFKDNGNGTWSMVDARVARIGETVYTSLQKAFDEVKEGETIVLMANCTEAVSVNKILPFTLKLNGHTLDPEPTASTDYRFNKSSDGTWTYGAIPYVAQITESGAKFETLAEAVAAANKATAGVTIKLLSNVAVSETLVVNNANLVGDPWRETTTVTFDANGYQVHATVSMFIAKTSLTYKGGTAKTLMPAEGNLFTVDGGRLRIEDGSKFDKEAITNNIDVFRQECDKSGDGEYTVIAMTEARALKLGCKVAGGYDAENKCFVAPFGKTVQDLLDYGESAVYLMSDVSETVAVPEALSAKSVSVLPMGHAATLDLDASAATGVILGGSGSVTFGNLVTPVLTVGDTCVVTVRDGRIGSVTDGEQGNVTLQGGVYATAPADTLIAEGYEVANNLDAATAENYPKTVRVKSQGGIEVSVTSEQSTQSMPIAIPDDIFTNGEQKDAMGNTIVLTNKEGSVVSFAEAAPAEKSAFIQTSQPNGLKVWQNVVMGIDGNIVTNNPVVATYDAVEPEIVAANEMEEPVKIKTPIVEFNPPPMSATGVTVKYHLCVSTDEGQHWDVWTNKVGVCEMDTPEFNVDVKDFPGDSLWKIEAVFTGKKSVISGN